MLLIAIFASSSGAVVLHVSPTGNDAHAGSEAAPFASIPAAVAAASKANEPVEIVIHVGRYRGDIVIPVPVGPTADTSSAPAWTIRAATQPGGAYDEVVIDGGRSVPDATPVDMGKGVYFLRYGLGNFEPSMWDAATRTRYAFVADRLAVEAFPATLAPGRYQVQGEDAEGLFFRTADSKPLAEVELGLAQARKGIIVQRPNVTIKGLKFRNFQLYFGVSAVSIEAAQVTVDSCDAWNCWAGYMVGEKIPDARILRCTARDVATGVKSYGVGTVVEDCRFFRRSDAFAVQEYSQDQCGVQFYTSHVQTVRRTLCVGFQSGIFIKASGGVLTLENNTIIGGPQSGRERGIGPNTWRPGTRCRGNIIVGYGEPISNAAPSADCTVTDNLIWLPGQTGRMTAVVRDVNAGFGGDNIVAQPRFVDENADDFRLAAASPGAAMGTDRQPVGALGVAPLGTVIADRHEPATSASTAASTATATLVGTPVVYANAHGAVILFRTSQPVAAAVEWGDRFDQRTDDADHYRRQAPPKDPADASVAMPPLRTDHCIAVLDHVAPGQTMPYRIVLADEQGAPQPVWEGRFALAGELRTLHVSMTGKDEETAGSSDQPFATLQYAVDRALPGDRVLVAPGIYTGSVWMTHGGVPGFPIRVESAAPWGAVLDGQRNFEFAIRLGRVANLPETWAEGCLGAPAVSHVHISGFEMRWYNGMCIDAFEASDISVTGCKLWGRHYVKGRPGVCEGLGATHCERVTIDHNLFFTLNTAVRFITSVDLRLTSNTAAKCFHRVLGVVNARGLYLRNNSFAFGGSYLLQIHGVSLDQIDSDYNNFAVHLRSDSGFSALPAQEQLVREPNDFYYGESKALAAWDERTPDKPDPLIPGLTAWRAITGQDQHSIFIHPRYADPQNRDFGLLPGSPNRGAGEHGSDIGALGVNRQ